MDEEMKFLYKKNTWRLLRRQPRHKVIQCKGVYKLKNYYYMCSSANIKGKDSCKVFHTKGGRELSWNVITYSKAHIHQSYCFMVAHMDLELEKMDVKTTFLHGEFEETIYMI